MKQISSVNDICVGINALLKMDTRLDRVNKLVDEVPLRLSEPGFRGLANIIVSQQVSKASATAIFDRMEKLIDPLTAENYISAGEHAWIEIGLSRPKQKTFLYLYEAISKGDLDLTEICHLPADEAMKTLTQVKGIGPWTAEVYLLFCAGHRDIFPAGDLALQEAVKVACNLPQRPNDKQTRQIAEKWSPWRGVAARLMWAYYAVLKDGRDATPG